MFRINGVLLVVFAVVAVSPLTVGAATKAVPYTVTARAGSGGTVTPSGRIVVPAGGSQSFAVAPKAGYHIVDVKLDGVSKGQVTTVSAPADFAAVKANSHKLAATFAADTCRVNVQSGIGGKVSVSSRTVKYGATIPFTVAPSPGYAVSSISVGAPGAAGTTPAGSYDANGVFTGTFTVTSGLDLSVVFAKQGAGDGGTGADTSGFTSPMLAGKTVYLVNSDGYSTFTFNANGTVAGSPSATIGTPVQNIAASWKISEGKLVVYLGSAWSYSYALASDSGSYWVVVEKNGKGRASSSRIYYGSDGLGAAEAYYRAIYGDGNSGGTVTPGQLTAMVQGLSFTFADADTSPDGTNSITFDASGVLSGTYADGTRFTGTWSVAASGRLALAFPKRETHTLTYRDAAGGAITFGDSYVRSGDSRKGLFVLTLAAP